MVPAMPPPPQDVRHWLQLIGHGEEGEWIDLGTVRGYHRIVFCQVGQCRAVRTPDCLHLAGSAWAATSPVKPLRGLASSERES